MNWIEERWARDAAQEALDDTWALVVGYLCRVGPLLITAVNADESVTLGRTSLAPKWLSPVYAEVEKA